MCHAWFAAAADLRGQRTVRTSLRHGIAYGLTHAAGLRHAARKRTLPKEAWPMTRSRALDALSGLTKLEIELVIGQLQRRTDLSVRCMERGASPTVGADYPKLATVDDTHCG